MFTSKLIVQVNQKRLCKLDLGELLVSNALYWWIVDACVNVTLPLLLLFLLLPFHLSFPFVRTLFGASGSQLKSTVLSPALCIDTFWSLRSREVCVFVCVFCGVWVLFSSFFSLHMRLFFLTLFYLFCSLFVRFLSPFLATANRREGNGRGTFQQKGRRDFNGRIRSPWENGIFMTKR